MTNKSEYTHCCNQWYKAGPDKSIWTGFCVFGVAHSSTVGPKRLPKPTALQHHIIFCELSRSRKSHQFAQGFGELGRSPRKHSTTEPRQNPRKQKVRDLLTIRTLGLSRIRCPLHTVHHAQRNCGFKSE